jgi:hypothetical protein
MLFLVGCADESKVICQPFIGYDETAQKKYDGFWDLNRQRETTEGNCDEIWWDGKRLK